MGAAVLVAAVAFGFMFISKLAESQVALTEGLSFQPVVAGVNVSRDSSKKIEQDLTKWDFKETDTELDKLDKQLQFLK